MTLSLTPPHDRIRSAAMDLVAFGVAEAASCVFAVAVFAGLAVTRFVDLGVGRYDVLFAWCVLVQLAMVVSRLETLRELAVIGVFHVLGLGLEVFKVHAGSWSYDDTGVLRIADVPLYSGFMYAAVGSFVCQSWRRLHLRIDHVPLPTALLVSGALYANFFTEHWIVDLRWVLLALTAVVIGRRSVTFRVRGRDHRMPLLLSFVLIALFIWFAENAATFLGAWTYASQTAGWTIVHPAKIGSWTALVVLSMMLVLALHQRAPSLQSGPALRSLRRREHGVTSG